MEERSLMPKFIRNIFRAINAFTATLALMFESTESLVIEADEIIGDLAAEYRDEIKERRANSKTALAKAQAAQKRAASKPKASAKKPA